MKANFFLLVILQINFIAAKIPKNVFLPTKDFKTSYPYITGATVRSICNYKLDATENFNPLKVEAGDIIFVMVNFLEHFFDFYHPKISKQYILVTHHFFDEADSPCPGKFEKYLNDSKLGAWFTHNPSIAYHPKLHPMPIGIAHPCFEFGNKINFDLAFKFFLNKFPKDKLLYMNICIQRYKKERKVVYHLLHKKPFCTVSQPIKPLLEYLKDLASSKFVVSPRGNGLDCYRTWEALMMGAFPIVKTSTLDSLFIDLPVLIVKQWTEITQEFLEKKYEEMKNKNYNFHKLFMPYWEKEICKIQNKIKSLPSN